MPLLATFIGSLATALVTFFAQFMTYQLALKLAAYTIWITILTTFLATVFVCINGLYLGAQTLFNGGGNSGGDWLGYFGMALGMFIPSNAGAVMTCIASVWISTAVYKVQKQAVQIFGH